MIDTSVVRVHQHGRLHRGQQSSRYGSLARGPEQKIHAVVDTNGLPVHLALTPGEAQDLGYVRFYL